MDSEKMDISLDPEKEEEPVEENMPSEEIEAVAVSEETEATAASKKIKSEKNSRGKIPGWAIVLITICCVFAVTLGIGLAFITNIANSVSSLDQSGLNVYSGPNEPYLAKISVVGEIGANGSRYSSSDSVYHHDWTISTIDTLIADENNKGIYLYLNTPGGTVYESDELYLKLMQYKEETGRPIYAYMGNMAASGGYYIAAASDSIYANRNTWTGSIGVTLGTIFDVSEFLDEHGIHTDTITSGENKAMGNSYDPLTDEQRAIYQSLVDDAYDQFIGIIVTGRGMSESKVRELADGRVYTANQALANGLIDEILGEKEAEDAVIESFEEGVIISNCYYWPATNYLSLLGASSGDVSIWNLLGLLGQTHEVDGDVNTEDAETPESSTYESDVAAVLGLVQEQSASGMPPLKYLYTG